MTAGAHDTGLPFLTARWENLLLVNFDCSPELLASLVPAGTELDPWRGSHILSLVGFHFVDTRLRGVPVPWHRTFEEVNLRFYVRRRMPDTSVRRAVVFIRELVPRRAVAWVARRLYNEPYDAVPMDHRIALDPETGGEVEYSWEHRGGRHRIAATVRGPAGPLAAGSEAEFITEHYWGYTSRRDGGTREYRVDHPRWRVWEASTARYDCPPGAGLYGPELTEVLTAMPRSAHVAEGSRVAVSRGRRLPVAG